MTTPAAPRAFQSPPAATSDRPAPVNAPNVAVLAGAAVPVAKLPVDVMTCATGAADENDTTSPSCANVGFASVIAAGVSLWSRNAVFSPSAAIMSDVMTRSPPMVRRVGSQIGGLVRDAAASAVMSNGEPENTTLALMSCGAT